MQSTSRCHLYEIVVLGLRNGRSSFAYDIKLVGINNSSDESSYIQLDLEDLKVG